MRSRLPTIIVFLLLGAIVNLAVAWSLPAIWQGWREDAWHVSTDALLAVMPHSHWELQKHDGTHTMQRTRLAPENPVIRSKRGHWYNTQAMYGPSTDYSHILQSGWPALSCQGTLEASHLGWTQGPSMPMLQHCIWPGFAINTIFYGLALWLLWMTPIVIHRRLRIKRGLCAKCAYPIGKPRLHGVRQRTAIKTNRIP